MASAAAAFDRQQFNWPVGRRIADWTIATIVFLGAFVIEEPAPYELLLSGAFVVWTLFGLQFNRHFAPMIGLLLLYLAGGFLSLTQMQDIQAGAMYMATTGILILSAIFFAAVVAPDPGRRLPIIKKAYIAAALIAALLGLAGYFHLFPGSDLFIRYDRVKGTFKDPNVFGPFVVLPIVFLFQDILTHRLRETAGKIIVLLILLLAVFLAFSRAAWGMTALAIVLIALLSFMSETRQLARFRIIVYFAVGIGLVAILLVGALSIPAIADLFQQRAQLVEGYDAGALGRFGRHVLGFFLVQESPLGIGPLQFATIFGEDEHNMWLKGFTTYGWLGGFAYVALVIWTFVAATPLIFKQRPWTPVIQCVFVVYVGQVMIHNVIDNDHWRHLFLIYGVLWGAVAAEKMRARDARRAASLAADQGQSGSLAQPVPEAILRAPIGWTAIPRAARPALPKR